MPSENEPMLKVICEINNYEHLQMFEKREHLQITSHFIIFFSFSFPLRGKSTPHWYNCTAKHR